MTGFLVVVAAHLSGAPVTLYWGNVGYVTKSGDSPAKTHFAPRIAAAASLRRDLFEAEKTFGRASVGFGSLVLANDAKVWGSAGALDGLLEYAFDGHQLQQYWGELDGSLAFPGGFTQILDATMLTIEVSRERVAIPLRSRRADMEIPLQRARYAGTGTLEGDASLTGKFKPEWLGQNFNVPLVLVNPAKLIYQAAHGQMNDVTDVRDRGKSLSSSIASWVAQSSPTASSLYAIENDGNGTYIAVGANGTIIRSTDYGATWTSESSPFGSSRIEGIAYDPDGDVWVCGGQGNKLARSTDGGLTWALVTSPFTASDTIRDVAFGNGTFVIVGGDDGIADRIGTSADGSSWTTSTSPFSGQWVSGAVYSVDIERWVVVSDSGEVAYSDDDAATFTRVITEYTTTDFFKVAYARGRFVATGTGLIISSEDGITWTQRLVPSGQSLRGIGFGGQTDAFVIGGNQDTEGSVYASEDAGLTWTNYGTTFGSNVVRGVSADASHMVIVGENGSIATASTPGTYASEADLLDNAQAPAAGTFKKFIDSTGTYVRLGSPPAGRVTADGTQGAAAANRTAGQLFAEVFDMLGYSGLYSDTDVTALDSLDAGVIGLWAGTEELRAASALDMIAGTPGAWWGEDRTGTYRIKQFSDPVAGPADFTLTDSDILGRFERIESRDPGRGVPHKRSTLRYRRNYAPQNNDLAAGLSAEDRLNYEQEWLIAEYEDTSIETSHPLARVQEYDTLYQNQADAAAEASRRQTLRGVQRHMYELSVRINATNLTIDLGDIVNITHPRFGFGSGLNTRVIRVEVDPNADPKRINLTVWR